MAFADFKATVRRYPKGEQVEPFILAFYDVAKALREKERERKVLGGPPGALLT